MREEILNWWKQANYDLKAAGENIEIELNPEYVVARYPNAANGVPAEQYNKSIAEVHLNCAEKVINWVKERIFSKKYAHVKTC